MLDYASLPAARLYEVEVSGWDSAENFFIEQCNLEWNEDSGKQVALKRTLNDSAIVLVRLLRPGESDRSHPVAFEAELVGKTKNGLHQFRLNRAAPRLRERASSAA
jgi:hypothetical protein